MINNQLTPVQTGPNEWQVTDGETMVTFSGPMASAFAQLFSSTLHKCSASEFLKRLPVITDPSLIEALEEVE